ncbi:hypothetical protein TURU_049067 [Turdus rufiventris]|nr:hypothetical protein TURU_049067 [Turdus rufiventris]
MWGTGKERLLPLSLPFCLRCGWLGVARQARLTPGRTEMVVAIGSALPQAVKQQPWQRIATGQDGSSHGSALPQAIKQQPWQRIATGQDGSSHGSTLPQAGMAAAMASHHHRLGWQWPGCLTTLGTNFLCTVLISFLNMA